MNQTQGRELGPVFKATGEELSPWVRRGLAKLRGRMNATGQSYGHHRERLPNGDVVTYTVILNGPVPVYQAEVESSGSIIIKIVLVSEAFMESGLVKLLDGSEAGFDAALYYTDDNKSQHNAYPTWLDWVGPMEDGTMANIVRTATENLKAISWDYDKYYVDPNPAYLSGASNGKLQMLVQAQYGTGYGTGWVDLYEFIDNGGSVRDEVEI